MEIYFKFRFFIEIIGYLLLAVLILGVMITVIFSKIYDFLKRFGRK